MQEFVFAGFRAVRSVDQAIGDAAHGRHHGYHGPLIRRGLHDGGGAANAVCIAHRGAAELHYTQGRSHALNLPACLDWPQKRGKKSECTILQPASHCCTNVYSGPRSGCERYVSEVARRQDRERVHRPG